MRVADGVPGFALGEYQKTVRTLLRHPLVTATYPDAKALPAVRRWADSLRGDLAEQFGYRLELHGHTARLIRVHDGLTGTRPAEVRGRVLDRRRYAYLALALAVLGRAGGQITLGELADSVAADAGRIDGLGLDTDRYSDRRAFVDAVGWLEERGALTLTDGSAGSWANDPERAEALYDVARDVVAAVYRPTRTVQHLDSAAALLGQTAGTSENARRKAAAQQARRRLVEDPVVYYAEVGPATRNHLRSPAIIEDVERLTGLTVERRAEGLLLVDTANFSNARFPGTGAVAQAGLLLLGQMADRIVDPDARRLPRHAPLTLAEVQQRLLALVDTGLPRTSVFAPAMDPSTTDPTETAEPEGQLPFISDSFLRAAMRELMTRYGAAFGEAWRADPDRLRTQAVELLVEYRLVARVDGGVLVLPLAGRYRNVSAKVKRRRTPTTLFDVGRSS